MMSIYLIVRIQLSFVHFSLLLYEFCILSKTECKSIYYHFRRDHASSSFRKLVRNKWICRETCDFFRDQHNTNVLFVHPTSDLMFSAVNADNTLNIKFEPICADTSSNLGVITSFLDIRVLLTNNFFLVIFGW